MYDPLIPALVVSENMQWSPLYGLPALTTAFDARYVKKTGDTMTGPLVVPPGATGAQVPQAQEAVLKTGAQTMEGPLRLDRPAGAPTISWLDGGTQRWAWVYDNVSDQFRLGRFTAAGAFGGLSMSVTGDTGTVRIGEANGNSGSIRVAAGGLTEIGGTAAGTFTTINANGLITSLPTYNLTTTVAASTTQNAAGTFFRSTSTGKFKTDRQPITDALSLIRGLNPLTFKSTHEADKDLHRMMGFIAEEVAEVIPEAEQDDGENYDVRAIVAILVKAVQELQEEVQTFKENAA